MRLSYEREIRHFIQRHVAGNLQALLSLLNHHTQSLFTDTRVLVVDLDDTVIGGDGDLFVDL
jgi:hypothetical protein